MGKSYSTEQIRERREKISHLLAKGYNQTDIMKELQITNMIYCRDMKYINEMNDRQLYGLAKQSPSETFLECINGLDEVIKECWKIYNNPKISINDKVSALKTLSDTNTKKLFMIQNAPEFMQTDTIER